MYFEKYIYANYLFSPERISSSREHDKSPPEFYIFEEAIQMHMVKMSVSHAELGTELKPIFFFFYRNLFSIFADNLIEAIKKGTIKSNDLQGVEDLQSLWTRCLGNLMYWPLIPMIILSLFLKAIR